MTRTPSCRQFRQLFALYVREAVDQGDALRVSFLLDVLELLADRELLDLVELALRIPGSAGPSKISAQSLQVATRRLSDDSGGHPRGNEYGATRPFPDLTRMFSVPRDRDQAQELP